ncbi:MAG: EVE domain-containing protein [Synechococcaceae cyanobacterium SM2_3_2]|nr:EVE domain-containing protein [Synechococcaceae cyanobacterium SM2_3_2]
MAYWLFQGNPKYYRVLDAIREFNQMPWLVTRYAKVIAVGDGVLVWISGEKSGIYALAEVIEPPQVLEKIPDLKYWADPSRSSGKVQAVIRFTEKLLVNPLLRSELTKDPVLKSLLVIRAPNATNFKVINEEWKRVLELRI